jgi:hypothetical protein
MGLKVDIKGKKFGKLTALKELKERTKTGQILWQFKCDCGKKSIHVGSRVKNGQIISCGCSRKSEDPQGSLIKSMFRDYQASAKTRNIDFNLPFEVFERLSKQKCYYCSSPPETRKRASIGKANGIDRIDSNKGYECENVRSCCKICNMAKNDLSDQEFHDWIRRIAQTYIEDNINYETNL